MTKELRNSSVQAVVRVIMMTGEWYTPFGLQNAVFRITGRVVTDGTVMRRVREIGGVEKRRVPGTSTWQYRRTAQPDQ